MTSMSGKVALVTGGGSGIGRAAALIFAREGAKVVIADIRDEAGQETVELVEGAGGQAIFVYADVTVERDVEGMVAVAMQRFGRLDAAFNNVGHPGYRV